jgi:hypothetical protein
MLNKPCIGWMPGRVSPCLFEHHGPQTVQKHSVLDVVFDCARQSNGLDIAPYGHKIIDFMSVINALHRLLDDRPFIQFAGDVVCRRADEFDAALVRFVVGARALEAGKERMVDINNPPRQLGAEFVGQHLHIARQDDEVGIGVGDDF